MKTFKSFLEQTEFVDFVLNEFMAPSAQAATPNHAKVWSAKKPEILQMWQNLRPNIPIVMTPMADTPEGSEHSSYGEDGVRITGSWNFISSVIARLKELMTYENPQQKLRLVFRGIDKTSKASRPDRQSYVFYCNLERSQASQPKIPQIPVPTM